MKVAIYSRGFEPSHKEEVKLFFSELEKYKIQYIIYQTYFEEVREIAGLNADTPVFLSNDHLGEDVEFIFSLGGDGTLLDTVTLIKDKPIGIVGINFGRLGFLSSIGKDNLQSAIKSLSLRTYIKQQRTLVHVNSSEPVFGDTPFGLNEFFIHRRDTGALLKIHTFLNGELLNIYWADGLIVATPTGSTGYSLSCGGSIVFPETNSFVITPIAPHHLNVRSLVVSDDNVISFEIENRMDDIICGLDTRKEVVPKRISLSVQKEQFTITLVTLSENHYLHTLQNKLIWGMDFRK